jgi:hypothetical protein
MIFAFLMMQSSAKAINQKTPNLGEKKWLRKEDFFGCREQKKQV